MPSRPRRSRACVLFQCEFSRVPKCCVFDAAPMLPDDVVLKPELIKTAKEAIESRTNRSYLPDTRAGGLQCRGSLHDHSRHRWGIDLYLGLECAPGAGQF